MVRVTIDTIRVSLVSPQRIVVLREEDGDRYIPIWVGPTEAEALALSLRSTVVPRPLTHDLLLDLVEALDATVKHVVVHDLVQDVFHALIVLDVGGREVEVDARPSDAINLAVRASATIYVTEKVLDEAGVMPETGIETSASEDEDLEIYADFIESLDLDSLGDE